MSANARMSPMLFSLPEALCILALSERPAGLQYAVAGATLGELSARGTVRLNGSHRIGFANAASVADPLLMIAMRALRQSATPCDLSEGLSRLVRADMAGHALDQLVKRQVVQRETRRIWWLIPTTRYRLADCLSQQTIGARIRAALCDGAPADAGLITLSALADTVGLLDALFAQTELSVARRCIAQEVRHGTPCHAIVAAVKEAQDELDAALFMMAALD